MQRAAEEKPSCWGPRPGPELGALGRGNLRQEPWTVAAMLMLKTLPERRSKLVVVPLILIIILGLLWTAFWFYAASVAQATLAGWREREEKLGRTFACGSQHVGGYPFRIEVRCSDASAQLRSASPPIGIATKDFLAVAQVYAPRVLIAEVEGPLTLNELDAPVEVVGEWTLAHASLRGLPSWPERFSVAVEHLKLSKGATSGGGTLFYGQHVEMHARVDPQSPTAHPVLDLAARLEQATAPAAGPVFAQPIDAEISTHLRGLKDLEPRPLAGLLRELQAAGGQLDIATIRIARGTMLATGSGTLRLSSQGRLDGELQLTIAGFDPKLLVPLIPELNDTKRLAGLSLLGLFGRQTQLEGRPAVAMPLRFSDGAVSLGPLPLGRTAALY
jgi:hypothetical protein